jgi:hypothetical protein
MKYEDFLAAWKASQQLDAPDSQRRFTIDQVQIHGTAKDRYAQFKVDVAVRLLTDKPVVVPLGMAGAILESQPQADDGDSARAGSYLDYDPQRGGFVAGLEGQPGEVRNLSLEVLVPLLRDGDATTLRLNCPRAVASRLTLSVAAEVGDVSVTGGALVSPAPAADGQLLLTVAGLGGDFQLTWKTAAAQRAELATVLSASGALLVSIDGRSIRTDARISVRSYGGSFDRFRVRLPAGAKLIQDGPAATGDVEAARPDYQITVEPDRSPGNSRRDSAISRQVVLVELPQRQQGPIAVELATEQPLSLGGADREIELAGFEVLGAVRQFGDVGLQVADDWQLRWDEGRYVRQVDPSALPSHLQRPLSAAFQYDRQPWSLRARLDTRPLRVHVTPDYVLECLPDEARLRVHLVYNMPGARAFEFRVAMQGWELTADPIESGGIVDRDRAMLTREGMLVLPLTQTSTRRAEVTFRARRPILGGSDRIHFPLPVPAADTAAVAELTVLAPPGIELLPDMSGSTGLIATPITEGGLSPVDDQGRQVFRYRSFLPEAVFAATRIVRPRDISAEVTARLNVTTAECRVEQSIDYQVRYQPIKQLQLELPSEWLPGEEQVEVTLEKISQPGTTAATLETPLETPLSFVLATGEVEAGGSPSPRRAVVSLPQPRMDRFRVRLRYVVSLDKPAVDSGAYEVPLVRPGDGRLISQRVVVHAPRGLRVSVDPAADVESWQPADTWPGEATPLDAQEYVATQPALSIPLAFSAVDSLAPQNATVERVWLQTWLAGNVRQDRAAFRFRSAGTLAAIELPPDVSPHEVEVVLDGKLADVPSRDEGRLVVRLSGASAGEAAAEQPHTLELRYRQIDVSPWVARRRLTPPQMIGATAWSEVYWQVVMPGELHIVSSPGALAAVGPWQWLGSFWGRRPALTQTDLENWSGATWAHADEARLAPSAAQNEYLYSGLAPLASIEIVTMPRWLIVLLASGAVLALAVVWVYAPIVGRGWVMVSLAIVVAALAVSFPEPAALLGQAAVLGLVLATVVALLRRLTLRPVRWPQFTTSSGSSIHSPLARSDSFVAPPPPASTSPTARARLSDSQR